MTDLKELEPRLKEIGCNFRFWGRAELRELANVLLPDETVEICVNGQYEGGFAMLVATDQRVLLIDKKPMYLTLEDIRFDMIAEVDYNHRMLNAAVFICTPNKSLRFIAYNHVRLRKLFTFVQQRVMEIRQHYQQQSQVWKEYADSLKDKQGQAAPLPPAPAAPMNQVQQPAAMPEAEQTSPGMSTGQAQAPVTVPPPAVVQHPPTFPPMPPIISAYTRLPVMSRQRQFLGSRALNSMMPAASGPQQR